MKVILRDFKNAAFTKLVEVKGLSVTYNTPGVQLDVENYNELFIDLVNDGFEVELKGRVLIVQVISITCFE